ncbi:hypothetical protein [Zobellia alginiliquefaciens]|uniref:hypothetical protein n=1 Tax=Zobellia alginiliquefaciens TaxID=3032586 RepID=UPI0023E267F1|nr:hypothetical protein [Zobellia alginiliquefaciens]
MVEVFITNIDKRAQAKGIVKMLGLVFSELKIDFDLDETALPFPKGHTVLRVEGKHIDHVKIMRLTREFGIRCEIMEDRIPQ